MADMALLNPDEQETVKRAMASNIVESTLATSHPGAPVHHPLIFSHPESSTLDAVIGEYYQGTLKVAATTNNMQSSPNFTILNTSILSAPYVTGDYIIPQGAVKPSEAFYYAISQWQINIPGVGNLSGNGISMLDMLLRSNPTDRRNFLSKVEPYAVGVTGGTKVTFCAPLYLPWNGPGWVGGGYNLDANVSASTFQINLQFHPNYQWIGGIPTGITGGTLPSSFTNLFIKVMNQLDVLNQAFAPSKISSRGLFRLPFPYYQQYPLFSTVNNENGSGLIQNLTLNGLPDAELVSIIIHGIPTANRGTPSVNTAVDITPVTFSSYRLERQGKRYIELETPQEIMIQNNYFSVGSSSGFNFDLVNGAFTTATGGVNTYSNTTATTTTAQFTALECFTSNPSNMMDGNGVTQLAQNFGGQIFTFYYVLDPKYTSSHYPLIDWYITYVSNGLLTFSGGVAKLIT